MGSGSDSQKASDLFVRCLEAEGVTHIFGVPGEENADVMISLLESKIEFVLCRGPRRCGSRLRLRGNVRKDPRPSDCR